MGNFSTSSLITDLFWIEVSWKGERFDLDYITPHIVCQEKKHTIYSYFLDFAVLRMGEWDLRQRIEAIRAW